MLTSLWHSGIVIKGKGRGSKLGFSTINLLLEKNLSLKHGVYLCLVKINQIKHQGLLHWGPIPTFRETKPVLEILIKERIKNLVPGNQVFFQPQKYLREIINFKKPQDLSSQVKKERDLLEQLDKLP